MAHEENFDHETDLSGLDELFQAVKAKLEKSSSKYGETHWLNDINEELRQEIIDILGWTSLQALRLLTVARSQFMDLDKVYWEKFFSHQTDESLCNLKQKIDIALADRRKASTLSIPLDSLKYSKALEEKGFTVTYSAQSAKDGVYPYTVTKKDDPAISGRYWGLAMACEVLNIEVPE